MNCPICHRQKSRGNRQGLKRITFNEHTLGVHILMAHGKEARKEYDKKLKNN